MTSHTRDVIFKCSPFAFFTVVSLCLSLLSYFCGFLKTSVSNVTIFRFYFWFFFRINFSHFISLISFSFFPAVSVSFPFSRRRMGFLSLFLSTSQNFSYLLASINFAPHRQVHTFLLSFFYCSTRRSDGHSHTRRCSCLVISNYRNHPLAHLQLRN